MASDQDRIFTQGQIESIAKILGDTEGGLKGSESGYFLDLIGVADTSSGMTKWKRLYNALIEDQNRRRIGNKVLSFIAKSLSPSRFINNVGMFNYLVAEVNSILAFHGLEYQEDGNFHKVTKISTLSEAQQRVEKMKMTIIERHLHRELLKYCREELVNDNYFHAVLEATKGLFAFIRQKSGIAGDGAELVDAVFSGENPRIKINSLGTKTEKSEQSGFMNLLKGVFGVFRNPVAHEPKNEWPIAEQDAMDLFSTLSYLYRRIDQSAEI